MSDKIQAGPEPVALPAVIEATANSPLNDIVHAGGGTGRVSFSAKDSNGLSLKDNGDGTFTLTGKAPANGLTASIDLSFADEGDPAQSGKATIAVLGVLSPHREVAAEQVRQYGA